MGRGYEQLLEDHWRQVTGEDVSSGRITPFWPVFAQNDEYKTLEWLLNTKSLLEEEQQPRAQNMINNIRFLNGIQLLSNEPQAIAVNSDQRPLSRSQMFILNHARDFINQSVGRITQNRPEIKCRPWSNEYSDKLGARFSKRVIDNLFHIHDSPALFESIVLEGYTCGESFLFTTWDPYTGDLDPSWDQAKSLGITDSYTTEYGEKMFVTEDGSEIPLEIAKRVGEVQLEQPLPWFVLQEPAFRWKEVNYIFKGRVKHIDEVRAENRGINLDKPSEAQAHINSQRSRDGSYGPGFALGEYVIEWEFFHRGHRFLDEGAYCKFIDGHLLKSSVLPYSHRKLPVSRFSCYTDPMNAHGISIFEDLKPPLVLYNKLMNLMYRNIAIGAHPKMMVPQGTVNINSLANGPLIVEYEGQIKPDLMTFQTIGGEVFNYSNKIMGDASKFAGTFGISRGDTMPNARAASILNFYEEQEEKQASSQIKKYSYFMEDCATKMLGTAGDFYDVDDGRTIRVFGKNNQYKMKKIEDTSKLSSPYDVIAERTTALSESKQGRVDQIQQLATIPLASKSNGAPEAGLFTREQVLRMIEVEDLDTFFEMATAAVERAESENEDLFEGEEVTDPQKYQAHVVDWNVHFQFMQSREFSDTQGIPEDVRKRFLDHFRTHEYWMYEKAKISLAFAQALMENIYFPAVFEIGDKNPSIAQLIQIHQMPPMPPPMPGAPAPAEGQAPAEEIPQAA